MPDRLFRDRWDAGRALAGLLDDYRGRSGVVVLDLPRGGVPVAYEVATALGAPLDIFLVRKLGVPGQEELAMGAIASGGVVVLSEDVVRGLGITPEVIQRVGGAGGQGTTATRAGISRGAPCARCGGQDGHLGRRRSPAAFHRQVAPIYGDGRGRVNAPLKTSRRADVSGAPAGSASHGPVRGESKTVHAVVGAAV
jgi:hypothetical protein